MKRTVSIAVLLSVALYILTGCNLLGGDGSTSNSGDTGGGNWGYHGVKAVRSYEEVMDALDIVKERHTVKPTYTVKDMGENYTVIYNFLEGGHSIYYPIDYETYFTTISKGHVSTFIFIENLACPNHMEDRLCVPSKILYVYKGDENYEEIIGYCKSYGCVFMRNLRENAEKIEDISLLRYEYAGSLHYYTFDVYYDERLIAELESCVPLSEEFFDTFFASLVTTHPVE